MSLRTLLGAVLWAVVLAGGGAVSAATLDPNTTYKGPVSRIDPNISVQPGTSDGAPSTDGTGTPTKPPPSTSETPPPPTNSTDNPNPPRRRPPPVSYPPPTVSYVIVPDVVTLELAEGEARLFERRLRMAVVEAPPEGQISQITAQRPPAGARVPVGTTVRVAAKAAEVLTKVPDLVGRKPEEASSLARQAVLSLVSSKAEPSSADDMVEEQQPAPGTAVAVGSKVFVVWSAPMAVVPKLVALSTAAARASLEKASLSIAVSGEPGVDGRIDTIEHQYPVAGTRVPSGQTVQVALAAAPPPAPTKPPTEKPPVAQPPVVQPPVAQPQPPPARPAPPPTATRPQPWFSMGMLFAVLSVLGAGAAWLGLRFAKHRLSHEHKIEAHGGIRVTARRDIGVQDSKEPKLAQPLVGVRVNWMSTTSMRTI
ncbi:MAG: PASTA domain-containing protein [Alphaproteobacteria bacterium]